MRLGLRAGLVVALVASASALSVARFDPTAPGRSTAQVGAPSAPDTQPAEAGGRHPGSSGSTGFARDAFGALLQDNPVTLDIHGRRPAIRPAPGRAPDDAPAYPVAGPRGPPSRLPG